MASPRAVIVHGLQALFFSSSTFAFLRLSSPGKLALAWCLISLSMWIVGKRQGQVSLCLNINTFVHNGQQKYSNINNTCRGFAIAHSLALHPSHRSRRPTSCRPALNATTDCSVQICSPTCSRSAPSHPHTLGPKRVTSRASSLPLACLCFSSLLDGVVLFLQFNFFGNFKYSVQASS